MSIHPVAAAHARSMPAEDAIVIANLKRPTDFTWEGLDETDCARLWDACRALLFTCNDCGALKGPAEYTESADCTCNTCWDSYGLENEHSDRGHDEHVDGCPTCANIAAAAVKS